jgi:hypothetical protein
MKPSLKFLTVYGICLLALVSNTNNVLAQNQISDVHIIPAQPNTTDDIKIAWKATFTSSDCSLNIANVNIEDNHVNLMLNYTIGLASAICYSYDTISIGTLAAGDYTLSHALSINDLDMIILSDTVNFSVTQGNVGLTNINAGDKGYEIYPNPTQHQITINAITPNFNIKSIALYNLMGQLMGYYAIQNKTYHLDLSGFSSQQYLMVITDDNNNHVHTKISKY